MNTLKKAILSGITIVLILFIIPLTIAYYAFGNTTFANWIAGLSCELFVASFFIVIFGIYNKLK